ncbi:MAG: hypothetical protein WBC33_10625 [Conexibacter sp.]
MMRPYPLVALVLAGVLGLGAGFGVERLLASNGRDRVRTVTLPVAQPSAEPGR